MIRIHFTSAVFGVAGLNRGLPPPCSARPAPPRLRAPCGRPSRSSSLLIPNPRTQFASTTPIFKPCGMGLRSTKDTTIALLMQSSGTHSYFSSLPFFFQFTNLRNFRFHFYVLLFPPQTPCGIRTPVLGWCLWHLCF